MKKVRIVMIFVCIALIAVGLTGLNYGDLSWGVNKSSYGLILVGLVGAFGMIHAIRTENKKK